MRPLHPAVLATMLSGCVSQASGATPSASEPAQSRLEPPPVVLPDAAVRFTVRLGVHDGMIARAPELAQFRPDVDLTDDELRGLREVILSHQPAGASVFGALSGPSADQIARARERLNASTDVLDQAFALDEALGSHARLYVLAEDTGALSKDLAAWVRSTYASQLETLPDRPCTAKGAEICVQSLNRFAAVTDEGWGVRLDVVALFWPSMDQQQVLDFSTSNAATRRKSLAVVRDRGYRDAFAASGAQIQTFWDEAYAIKGLEKAPSASPVVSASVDPHAFVRLAQASGLTPEYAYKLGAALRQASEGLAEREEPAVYSIPPLGDLTATFPFTGYVAHWAFEDDARSIDIEWTLNPVGRRLLRAGSTKTSLPATAKLCEGTSACVVIPETLSGLLNAEAYDPTRTASYGSTRLMWPVILGAWPNVLAELAKALPIEPFSVDGALVGAAWRDGWGHAEFAARGWSSEAQAQPVADEGTVLPLHHGRRYYTSNSNFVVVDAELAERSGWIAASDLVRADWLRSLAAADAGKRGSLRIPDLHAANDVLWGPYTRTLWSELAVDLTIAGDILRGQLVFRGRRSEAGT